MQVCCTVESVWRRVRAGNRAGGFQLLGFDFMLDDAYKASLLEINSSPAVAEKLREGLAEAFANTEAGGLHEHAN